MFEIVCQTSPSLSRRGCKILSLFTDPKAWKLAEVLHGVARCCYSLFASYILNISLSMFQWFANVSINCLSHYVIGINAGSEFNMTYLKASRILPLMRPGEPWHYIVCFRFVCPAWYLDTILFRDWYLDKPIWTIWISQFAIVCSCQGQQQLQELLTLNISEVWRQKAMVWKKSFGWLLSFL